MQLLLYTSGRARELHSLRMRPGLVLQLALSWASACARTLGLRLRRGSRTECPEVSLAPARCGFRGLRPERGAGKMAAVVENVVKL